MTKRTPEEIYAALITAGFPSASAQTMTAIALGESGGDDAAQGDIALQDSTWGPSYGLFQIRTQKAATGTGGVRDIAALAGDIDAQAKAAYEISGQGRDFTPWTVYTSGRYQQFRAGVLSAVRKYLLLPIDVVRKLVGLGTAPIRAGAGAVADAGTTALMGSLSTVADRALDRGKRAAFEVGALVLGGGLLIAGMITVARRRS